MSRSRLKGGAQYPSAGNRPHVGKPLKGSICYLMDFLEKKLFTDFQIDYRKGRSTITSVGALTDKILICRNVGMDSIATFFRHKTAFDMLNNKMLLTELELMGLREICWTGFQKTVY